MNPGCFIVEEMLYLILFIIQCLLNEKAKAMKQIFIVLFLAGFLLSFKEPTPKPTTASKAPVDLLIAKLRNGWNDHDSTTIRNLFVSDAILIDEDIIAMNADELSTKWISPFLRMISNMKFDKLQEWSTDDRAGYTGKYEMVVTLKDSSVVKMKGVLTVNWIKTATGDWKITTCDIHSPAATT